MDEIPVSASEAAFDVVERKPKFYVFVFGRGESEFSVPPAVAARFFWIEHEPGKETITRYPDGCWSGCGPVPDDEIHGRELGVSPARHRLEHDLWHHLVGAYVYGKLGSPVIWRDAHHVPQPERFPLDIPRFDEESLSWKQKMWSQADEEEWLVTALSHRYHGRFERDHGAGVWLRDNGFEVERMLEVAEEILSKIPADTKGQAT